MNDKLTSTFKGEKRTGKNVTQSRTVRCPEAAKLRSQNGIFGNHPSVVYEMSKTLWNSNIKQPLSCDQLGGGAQQSRSQDLLKIYGSMKSSK
jgi:hypothetical protein